MRSAAPLLALMWCACRTAAPPPAPLFREAAVETGLHFVHSAGATGDFFMPEIMGAGAALLDYDSDGDLDVYLIQSAGPDGSRLFRNDLIPSGKLHFTDDTRAARAGVSTYGMGAATGDYDGDGDTDLYITAFGHNTLLRNDRGVFTDVTGAAAVDDDRWSTSAAFLDYDRDGRLDLFALNYVDFTYAGNKRCYAPTGEPDYCTPKMYKPVNARLFHNEGNGRFSDATERAGIASARGPGLGVAVADFNSDGFPDLYVANDGAQNLLWINRRNGTFEESSLTSGAAYSDDGVAKAGMGVTAADFDDDGDDDVFVVNLTREGATLYRNDGRAGFSDATLAAGLMQPTYPFTGFGTRWFDFDNDGRLDLFVSNGGVTLIESLRGSAWPFHQKNTLLRNEGGKFRDVAAQAGAALALSEVSRGAAFGDLDNDGDVDIVVTNNNGPARLLLNQAAEGHHWLEVDAPLGARIGVFRPGRPTLWRDARTDGSYLSASDPRVHFGLGREAVIEKVEVVWPDGVRQSLAAPKADRLIRVRR
ncbi:MAG: CRTAC1 family protein, partial [Bryobacteraceae bacterium]